MHWYGYDHMGWMAIWWVLGAALIVALLWAFVRGTRGRTGDDDTPEKILERRYARGEIDHDTFERMSADLKR